MNSSKLTACKKTIGTEYHHHWDCKYVESGHPGCTCGDGKNGCLSGDCTIRNPMGGNDKRFPDGSIVMRKGIMEGGIYAGVHHISGKSEIVSYGKIHDKS